MNKKCDIFEKAFFFSKAKKIKYTFTRTGWLGRNKESYYFKSFLLVIQSILSSSFKIGISLKFFDVAPFSFK